MWSQPLERGGWLIGVYVVLYWEYWEFLDFDV